MRQKTTEHCCDTCMNLFRTVPQWTDIIDLILKKRPDAMKVRVTGHKHRTDNRDIMTIVGLELPKRGLSIDGLPYNIESDEPIIRKLLEIYEECK